MKIYLDQSIIQEWLEFKSSKTSLYDYLKDTTMNIEIATDLKAFSKILQMQYATFLYSSLNELECSNSKEHLFKDFVSQNNFVKVPSVGISICMVHNQDLPENNIIKMDKVRSYFGEHVRKIGPKKIKNSLDLLKYMRQKWFDPMHIDSAIRAGADVFLTTDYTLLRSIDQDSNLQSSLATKVIIAKPSEFKQKVGL